MLAGLRAVDWVTSFEEDTPLRLVCAVAPDVLVKGGDYALDSIMGASEVLARGGKVIALPFHEGHSTTAIIKALEHSGSPA
jgi:D-beta-D-heptose 7-phosphate kinase/D-beta-D-heptose 1-phosphate adenosyltransferase